MDYSKLISVPQITGPLLPIIPSDQNLADAFYERLSQYIIDFESTLNDAEEVGARLVSFGESITFHIEDIGYWNPSLITFSGRTEDGKAVKLVQHVSQISVLLMAVPRTHPERERIGYTLKQNLEEEK